MRHPFGPQGQQLRHAVERVRPFRSLLEDKGAHILLAGSFADEICHYSGPEQPCRGHALPAQRPAETWSPWLASEGVDFVYLDEQAWANPVAQDLLAELPADAAWRRLAPGAAPQHWGLLAPPQRQRSPTRRYASRKGIPSSSTSRLASSVARREGSRRMRSARKRTPCSACAITASVAPARSTARKRGAFKSCRSR